MEKLLLAGPPLANPNIPVVTCPPAKDGISTRFPMVATPTFGCGRDTVFSASDSVISGFAIFALEGIFWRRVSQHFAASGPIIQARSKASANSCTLAKRLDGDIFKCSHHYHLDYW